ALGLGAVEEGRVDRAGRHRVDLDAVRAEVAGEAAREAHHARLGDAVPEVGVRRVGGDGRQIYDSPLPAGNHSAGNGLNESDWRLEVDAQDAGALRVGVLVDRHRRLHAGVVDQHVDRAERLDQPRNAGEVGEVIDQVALL